MNSNPLKKRSSGVIEHSTANATNSRVFISQFPNIAFFITDSMVPGINLLDVAIPHSRGNAFLSDNVIDFDLLTLGFMVDEQLYAYTEVFQWMTDAYSPTDRREEFIPKIEIDVVALDNNKNPLVTFKMKDCRPTSLGQLTYDVQDEQNNTMVCDVTFRFDSMTVIRHGSTIPEGLDDAAGEKIE